MRRLAAALALLAALAASPLAGAPHAQREDGLDTPLLQANMCGAGGQGEVHFTLAATGDTFPHENIQAVGEAGGYDALFDHVRPFLQAADLAYTNFDGAMLEGSPLSGYPAFNYSPRLAEALRRAGIGLVSTANNHILDRGPEGLDATLGVLAQSGILQHGAVPSAEAAGPRPPYLPIRLERDGAAITVGFISASWGTNGLPDPYGQVNLLWESSSYGGQGGVRQSVLDAIAQARRETDAVVVAAHWGEEYQFYPQPYQVEGARRMVEAGADVILGAQSHTLQPVDVVDAGGRRGLVVYSLANFLASQGAFQQPYYSATSVVFYVGLARQPDGAVRVTGYRYLPTLHVDGDTRPAPLPPGNDDVAGHVRLIMRDPGGLREVPGDPALLGGRVEVCPAVGFAEAPGVTIGGDFAQHYATLGGGPATREPRETIAVLGLPLGPVERGPAGDCAGETAVLYTERQRLEWHAGAAWPYRVVGTQLGAEAFRRRYGAPPPPADLAPGAFADARLRDFFERYGGLPVFGYPLGGALTEQDAAGRPVTVQYFERARLELVPDAPPDADLLAQVRVAPLGRQARDEGWVCRAAGVPEAAGAGQEPGAASGSAAGEGQGEAPTAAAPQEPGADLPPGEGAAEQPAAGAQGPVADAAQATADPPAVWAGWSPWWVALVALAALALALVAVRALARRGAGRARTVPWRSWQEPSESEDEALLRKLLGE